MKRIIVILMLAMGIMTAFADPVTKFIERIQPGASKHFKTELVKADKDFFEIDKDQAGKRIVIRGAPSRLHQSTALLNAEPASTQSPTPPSTKTDFLRKIVEKFP